MNIAVIAKTRLPIAEPFRGGLEAFTSSLCQEYMRLGHDITLYAHADSNPALHVKSFYGEDIREDDNYEIYENDEYLSIISDIQHKNFDIVHNNSMHELPIIWGTKAEVPVVTTLHAPPVFSKMLPAITAASAAHNLHFVAISSALADSWQPYLQRGATIIHNGVDLDKWPVTRRTSEYLFWYGRIVAAKGLDSALDAAHQIGMPLRFAGSVDDTDYYETRIQPRIQATDTYLGHLTQQEIVAELHAAAALINAARWEEPFGLTTIEAMSAGVPVASFDRGAFKEIITHASGAIASGTTISSLASAIKQAIPLQTDAVRARAEHFSIRTMATQYCEYFRSLV